MEQTLLTSEHVHEIVEQLLKDSHLVQNRDILCGALGIYGAVLMDIQLNDNSKTTYGFLTMVLERWISMRDESTFGELAEILNNIEFNSAADKIRNKQWKYSKKAENVSSVGFRKDSETEIRYRNVPVKATQHKHDNPTPAMSSNRSEAGLTRRSEVDPRMRIDDTTSVISLIRNSHADRNTQHVFMVLEEKSGDKAKTYFMDFVVNPLDAGKPNISPGKIRIDVQVGNFNDSLLYLCPLQMMGIIAGRKISHFSCAIDRALGVILVQSVSKASKAEDQPIYNFLGVDSVFTQSSAWSSSNDKGHNCFTWACHELKDLKDETLNATMPKDPLRFIISIPSRTLYRQKVRPRSLSKVIFALVFIVGTFFAILYFRGQTN